MGLAEFNKPRMSLLSKIQTYKTIPVNIVYFAVFKEKREIVI